MPDRDKVIKGLECCTKGEVCISDCPYFREFPMTDGRCITALQADALALLKQETVVHCGDCENFCFDNISPNAGRCILTNKSHSRSWFCAHGKREDE